MQSKCKTFGGIFQYIKVWRNPEFICYKTNRLWYQALFSATLAAASAQYPIPVGHAGLGYAPAAYGAYPSFGVAPAAYHAAAPFAVAAPVAPVAVAPIAPKVTSSQYRAEDGSM